MFGQAISRHMFITFKETRIIGRFNEDTAPSCPPAWNAISYATEYWSYWRAKFPEFSLPTLRETLSTQTCLTHRHLAWLRWATEELMVGQII